MSAPEVGTDSETVHGWAAAAEIAERSVASVRKLVESGRLNAEKNHDGVYVMRRADLLALPRVVRSEPGDAGGVAPAGGGVPEGRDDDGATSGVPVAPNNTHSTLDGALAAQLFEAFEANQSVIAVVVSTKVAPEIVESAYTTWARLKSADVSSSAARSRLDEVEADIQTLDKNMLQWSESVGAHDSMLNEQATSIWRLRQWIENLATRLTAVERRFR